VRIVDISCSITLGIIVGANSDISAVTDLRNRRIAVLAGTGAHYGVLRILEDNGMSGSDVEIIDMLKEKWNDLPIVGITNYETELAEGNPAVILKEEMRSHGDSVYDKRVIYPALPNIIRDKIAISKLQKEVKEVKEENKKLTRERDNILKALPEDSGKPYLIGKSAAMRKVYGELQKLKPANTSILILGETGTGKELIARAIHEDSPRKELPYEKENCSLFAGDAGMVKSMLFGHKKGDFTGATDNKIKHKMGHYF